MRLDRFLTIHVPGCSRRSARRAVAAGGVRVNGRATRKGQAIVSGDIVGVPDELYAPPKLQPNPGLAVHVLYEDGALIAIDKPAGMPSHALRGEETDTAANFLLAHYPELAEIGTNDRAPGIVHRLDTDTSGVLLAARTAAAFRTVRAQFATHRVGKEYLAVVQGDVAAAGEIRAPIAHDRHNRRKMRVCATGGQLGARLALTRYRPLERFGAYTLLRVEIPTGVTHQIRVHLASMGHPIVGDRLYGGVRHEGEPPRQLLHATRLTVAHPQTGQPLTVVCEPPADFDAFVRQAREKHRAFTGRTRKARQQ
jgi:23S rRNA pseudouridine1911/1915/1917 synthase